MAQLNTLIDGAGDNETAAEKRARRMNELKTQREQKAAEKVAERATDPDKNPNVRPPAPPADENYIYYNSWIGGATTGEWRTYRVPNNQINQAAYGSRALGGETQASGASAVGANSLASQPQPIKDSKGNIIGWKGGTTGTGSSTGVSTGSSTGTAVVGSTGGAVGSFAPTTTYTAPDGRVFTDLNAYNNYIAQTAAETKRRQGQSAYDLLFSEFDRYGMGALVEPLKQFITEGLSRDEFTLRLRQTDAYQKRFAANADRVKRGLRALSEAEYIGLEDQYQNVMRNYGLPASYYQRGDMGRQQGFEKFISGDVSAAELEDRIQTAQNRVINAAPEVSRALREFYPDITGGDILAYALDPDQALTNIRRKVTAAEIGAGAMQAGLATGLSRAEELQRFGVTGEQARQGFSQIAEFLPSATKLSDIYGKQGVGPYNQATAEQEVFGISGAADAANKRKRLAQLETAQFSGQVGAAGGALGRERAGQF